MTDAVNRVLGRSVRDLAGEVDEALGRLAQARGLEAVAQDTLAMAQADVSQALRAVEAARDALFEQHPDLAPKGWGTTSNQEQPVTQPHLPFDPGPGLDPSKFEAEVLEVDDMNDPRFTGGVSPVSSSSDEPLPDIEWGEDGE